MPRNEELNRPEIKLCRQKVLLAGVSGFAPILYSPGY
jgi:hypothetical protein